jgi:hypothetical protein
MFSAKRLATLLYPSGSANDPSRHHLFVLLTDPFGPAEQVLMACICTIVEGADESCLLKNGDHDFIKHDSYVAYGFCRIESAKALIKGVEQKVFLDKGHISEAIYKKLLPDLGSRHLQSRSFSIFSKRSKERRENNVGLQMAYFQSNGVISATKWG